MKKSKWERKVEMVRNEELKRDMRWKKGVIITTEFDNGINEEIRASENTQ